MRAAAALMGSSRSERKVKAARENGKLGGKARIFIECSSGKPHRWKNGRCRLCGQPKAALKLKAVKRQELGRTEKGEK